ncbi:nucleoside triphosphatase [Sulfolobus sp. SCGC AB-777_G05]|nr:nucleoside triphosphatase [Sulfolobus sp. SCGC AB-777_G05]
MQTPIRIYITGKPGVGKTTLLNTVVNKLREKGIKITGFYCPEVREGRSRVGFKIKSFTSETEDWLARIDIKSEVKIGKYYVTLRKETVEKLESEIFDNPKLIAIDEIGPMELSVPTLKELIYKVINSQYPVLAVIHRSLKLNGQIYELTIDNREIIKKKILEALERITLDKL